MTLGPAFCFFLLLSITVPGLHAYGRGSHPKCTTMPASEVYRGTCYFQYEIGRGYVRKTCPSGTLYSQWECGCVRSRVTQRSARGMTTRSVEVETTDDNDYNDDARTGSLGDKSMFLHNLLTGGPLSMLKFLFGDNDDDRNSNNFFAKDDKEGNDGNHDSFDDFDNFLFYGDEADGQEFGPHDFWDQDQDEDFDFSRTMNSRGKSAYGTISDDKNDNASKNDAAVVTNDFGEQPGQASSEYSKSGSGEDEVYSANSRNTKTNLFDQLAAKGFIQFENNAGATDTINVNTDDDKDDVNERNDDTDSDKENYEDDFNNHSYRSIYGIKGLLNPQKKYRYEDLFVNLLVGDDNDNDDEQESDNDIMENYHNIYEEKLDGVLEYTDDLFNDIFNDDFDHFYEDLFDGDGYDDCFVKKYAHYFDQDFENELDEKYADFDEFFKNHKKIKSLINDDADDDDKADDGIEKDYDREDSYFGNSRNMGLGVEGDGNMPFIARGDRSDDLDENGWPGSTNLKSFAASLDNRKQSKPRDSRLFDFSRMLRRNNNQPRNVLDVFYRGPPKY